MQISDWHKKKVLFLGDSISHGAFYIDFLEAYLLEHFSDECDANIVNIGLSAETVSGLSETGHPFPRPCLHDRLERALKKVEPDFVFLCYGMNDAIYAKLDEARLAAYQDGVRKALAQAKGCGAITVLLTPTPFDTKSYASPLSDEEVPPEGYLKPYQNYNETLCAYAQWAKKLTPADGADYTVDVYSALSDYLMQAYENNADFRSGDGIHPNPAGHWVMTKTILKSLFHITLDRVPDYVVCPQESRFFSMLSENNLMLANAWREAVGHSNPNKAEALPLEEALEQAKERRATIVHLARERGKRIEKSDWYGFTRYDFYVHGREGLLIEPKRRRDGSPWIWRAEFFGAFDKADRALLEDGGFLGYCRLSDLYGNEEAVALMEAFRRFVTGEFGLRQQAVLFGFSRGGLYSVNYTARYPKNVAALYLDAPVLDIKSWPKGAGKGGGAPKEWIECLAAYHINEEGLADFRKNPLDHIPVLLENEIPILLVAGGADTVVPYAENGALLAEKYQAGGGTIQVIVKPDCGHHPHSLEDVTPIEDYLKQFL